MPYKEKTEITIIRPLKRKLERMKEDDETWSEFIGALMNFWIEKQRLISRFKQPKHPK